MPVPAPAPAPAVVVVAPFAEREQQRRQQPEPTPALPKARPPPPHALEPLQQAARQRYPDAGLRLLAAGAAPRPRPQAVPRLPQLAQLAQQPGPPLAPALQQQQAQAQAQAEADPSGATLTDYTLSARAPAGGLQLSGLGAVAQLLPAALPSQQPPDPTADLHLGLDLAPKCQQRQRSPAASPHQKQQHGAARRPAPQALLAARQQRFGPLPYTTRKAQAAARRAWLEAHRNELMALVRAVPGALPSARARLEATRAAVAALPHEALAAMFDRIDCEIAEFGLSCVQEDEEDEDEEEEGSGDGVDDEWGEQPEPGGESGPAGGGAAIELGFSASSAEAGGIEGMIGPLGDATFLTAVGLTGQLPCGGEAAGEEAQQQRQQRGVGAWEEEEGKPGWVDQDPTERLAVALGLDVRLLAHRTAPPGAPRGDRGAAAARLRHALAHPLVEAGAGGAPRQHHVRATAASVAKRRPRAEPAAAGAGARVTPAAAKTRVRPVVALTSVAAAIRSRLQALESSLVKQLEEKAQRITAAAAAAAATAAGLQAAAPAGSEQPAESAAAAVGAGDGGARYASAGPAATGLGGSEGGAGAAAEAQRPAVADQEAAAATAWAEAAAAPSADAVGSVAEAAAYG
ncbi:hypothetical protein Rsub_09366 [Raphidocelis subcapitata]|uniref:Uncharacterized protein n=1 Tax=Raphidocelis subcapitata TaxID=307507 RepID=A0A2V0PFF3_9CHLO|nr:hypothetical protein Rsub_09366 [Raphidocelis subcapitata]|eukprot:GBF96620.1 hypothetical protein Rsub_09366 [Raphidocelis subcapitata]